MQPKERKYLTGKANYNWWVDQHPRVDRTPHEPKDTVADRHDTILTYHRDAGAANGVYYTISDKHEVVYIGSTSDDTFGARTGLRDKYEMLYPLEKWGTKQVFETRCLRSDLKPGSVTHYENVFSRAWWIVVGRLSRGHTNDKNTDKHLLLPTLTVVDLDQVQDDLLALLNHDNSSVSNYERTLWDKCKWKDGARPSLCDFDLRVKDLISVWKQLQQRYKASALEDADTPVQRSNLKELFQHVDVENAGSTSVPHTSRRLFPGSQITLEFYKAARAKRLIDIVYISNKVSAKSTHGQKLRQLVPIA
jgi:hypothetical protein